MKHCFAFSSDFLARCLVSFGFLSHVKRLRRHLGNLLFAGRQCQGSATHTAKRCDVGHHHQERHAGTVSALEPDTCAPVLGSQATIAGLVPSAVPPGLSASTQVNGAAPATWRCSQKPIR
jgi:hypothetical protein